jgi:hypothetical protein
LIGKREKAKARFDEVTGAIAQRSAKGERLAGFIRTLEAQIPRTIGVERYPIPLRSIPMSIN